LGKKCNIWSSLIPPPLLLRQLKNNQNQTNTTGARSPCLKLRHVDCLAFKKLQITQVLWK
jgi:hypothetical protein